MRVYDLFVTVLCFEIGIFFVNVVTGNTAAVLSKTLFVHIGTIGFVSVFTGLAAGLASKYLTNADPIQVATLSIIVTGFTGLVTHSTLVLDGFAQMLDGANNFGIARAVVVIFGIVMTFLTVIGTYQMVTGGWKNVE